jgi:protoporphyrinogen oxidase
VSDMSDVTQYDTVVLGAGPAGVMAALRLARDGRRVVVLERADAVGGMAGSFEVAGVRVDFGSHRLHTVVQPWLRDMLRELLGDELEERARRGRVALKGQWLRFPLRIGDLARKLPPTYIARIGLDMATGPLRRRPERSAGDAIANRLGPTVAKTFYTPYLVKLWGLPPDELDVELADRRISARSGLAVIKKALRRDESSGSRYLYPKRGFGRIAESIAGAAEQSGAEIRLGVQVTGVATDDDGVVVTLADGSTVRAASLLSSVPASVLARLIGAPEPVLEAAGRLRHRAMVLAYLVFDVDRLTEFDAHYFPGLQTPVSRMSEPKNFRVSADDPVGTTVLCAELPCWVGDETWDASADEVAARVIDTLTPLGFEFPALAGADVRRIPHCYPVYAGTYRQDQGEVEAWLDGQDRILAFGRQALFATDNTHHVLQMGWDAAGVVQADGTIDRQAWQPARDSYRENVVED